MERGVSHIIKALGIPLDIFWTPQFCLDNSDKTYYEPFLAALKYSSVDSFHLGYWSLPFAIDENDIKIITYSQPLLTPGGKPYGVLGIELTVDYLRKQMPFEELNAENSACYALAVGYGFGRRAGGLSAGNVQRTGLYQAVRFCTGIVL